MSLAKSREGVEIGMSQKTCRCTILQPRGIGGKRRQSFLFYGSILCSRLVGCKIVPDLNGATEMKQILHTTLFTLLLGSGLFDAHAQTVPDSLSGKKAGSDKEYTIEEVTVVGKHTPSEVIPAQVLSGRQLQKLNTVSVADAIRYFPVYRSRTTAA